MIVLQKKKVRGFTLSGMAVALSLVGLVFLTLGFVWQFLWNSFVSNDRESVLYAEAMVIAATIEKDMSFISLTSAVRHGQQLSGGGAFSIPIDTDNNYMPDTSVSYTFTQPLLRRGPITISDKVTSFNVTLLSPSIKGTNFIVKINLTLVYDPTNSAGPRGSPSNPQHTFQFTFPAKQISVG